MSFKARIRVDAYTGAPEFLNIDIISVVVEVDDVEAVHALMDQLAELIEPHEVKESK